MSANDSEHIWLRQTVTFTVNGQTRTLEIGIPLARNASAQDVEALLGVADAGMSALSRRLDAQVTEALAEDRSTQIPLIDAERASAISAAPATTPAPTHRRHPRMAMRHENPLIQRPRQLQSQIARSRTRKTPSASRTLPTFPARPTPLRHAHLRHAHLRHPCSRTNAKAPATRSCGARHRRHPCPPPHQPPGRLPLPARWPSR